MRLIDLPPEVSHRLSISEVSGCWIWAGDCYASGAGQVRYPPDTRPKWAIAAFQVAQYLPFRRLTERLADFIRERRGRLRRVDRLVWELAYGRDLTRSEHLRHICDVRACCNPRHMEVVRS